MAPLSLQDRHVPYSLPPVTTSLIQAVTDERSLHEGKEEQPTGHLGAASLNLIHAQFGNCPLHSPQRLDEGPSPPWETALAQAKWAEPGPLQAP